MILCLAIVVLGAGGCAKEVVKPAPDPVRVLATTYAMADIARQIGGDRVDVQWWIESGQSLAPIPETPQRRQQWRNADLVITRGLVDLWTTQGVGNAYQDRRILRVDTLPSARNSDAAAYFWLDPRVGIEIAQEVTTRLVARDPRGEEFFQHNRDAFIGRVATLTEQASTTINRAGGGAFMTLDRGFVPLAARFGLSQVPIPPQFDLEALSSFGISQLRQAADQGGAAALFASSETPAPLLRDLSARLGLNILTLDPMGSSASTGHSTYLDLLRYNLEQLEHGVKGSTQSPGALSH